ncbi:DUF742 domain-containing protein [Umezawaea endophytica]|uniref:DUF742 domain-containing protein n=1 Tax=Umezawaea endophytica TaxID=1654476 RepID=A0A9X3A335_9PSEU|nr:DUF742 domain-containing protein [Umezawaea endophytica]MCS7481304.1 DUF742 domain-containing protein [Umezawaea endophytica]
MVDGAELGSTGGGRRRRRSLRGEVGRTGARFGSAAVRRDLEEDDEVGYVPAHLEVPEPPKPRRARRSLRGEVGQTGARFGSAAVRRAIEEDEPAPEPVEVTTPMPAPVQYREPIPEPHYDEPYYEETGKSLVRPYAWTGGRTTANVDLRLETLISVDETRAHSAASATSPEQRSIVEMCANPRSVAEVSAVLSIPLGVARVLLSDLIELGVVSVHETNGGSAGGRADLALLERVLNGLRRL